MKMVVDTNILLSAMIKDSLTRKIIMNANLELYYPQIAFSEVNKHKNIVMKKAHLDNAEYERLFEIIVEKIILVKLNRIESKIQQATERSNDLDFKAQKVVRVFNTTI